MDNAIYIDDNQEEIPLCDEHAHIRGRKRGAAMPLKKGGPHAPVMYEAVKTSMPCVDCKEKDKQWQEKAKERRIEKLKELIADLKRDETMIALDLIDAEAELKELEGR